MQTQGQFIEFVEKVFGQGITSNAGQNISVICPFCLQRDNNTQKKKFVIRTSDSLCHCWVCGYKSHNLYEVLKKFKPAAFLQEYRSRFYIKEPSIKKIESLDIKKRIKCVVLEAPPMPQEVFLPEDFKPLCFEKGNSQYFKFFDYLKKRGISEEDLWYWKIGIARFEKEYESRILIPSFSREGKLNYYSARTISSTFKPKYKNLSLDRKQVIFNDLNINWKEELTIVEGVFDLLKCNKNATCLLGSTLDKSSLLFQEIIKNKTPVLLALDSDAKQKSLRIALLFQSYGIKVRIVEIPANFHDVGEMSKEEFLSLASSAREFSRDKFLEERLNKC